MELNEREELLIRAVRELNEAPANVLLWYAVGLESQLEGAHELRKETDGRKIKTARSWMRNM